MVSDVWVVKRFSEIVPLAVFGLILPNAWWFNRKKMIKFNSKFDNRVHALSIKKVVMHATYP